MYLTYQTNYRGTMSQLFSYLLLLFVSLPLLSSAVKAGSPRGLYKKICPTKRYLQQTEFDRDLLERAEYANDFEQLCNGDVPKLSKIELVHQKELLLKHVKQLLRINITERIDRDNRIADRGRCLIDSLPRRWLRKVHRCLGLTAFPKLSAGRTKRKRAAQLLLEFVFAAYTHWYAAHEHSLERSRQVWNDEVLHLEESVGHELRIILENSIPYVKGTLPSFGARLCEVTKTTPTDVFHEVLRGEDRDASDCLKLTLFRKIEEGVTRARDLIQTVHGKARSRSHRRRHHRNRKSQ